MATDPLTIHVPARTYRVIDAAFLQAVLSRAGKRLDAARVTMDRECAAGRPVPSEQRMGEMERNLHEARSTYRACIERLTGQSADDVERRLGS